MKKGGGLLLRFQHTKELIKGTYKIFRKCTLHLKD